MDLVTSDDENLEASKQDERYPFAVNYAGLKKSTASATGLSFVDGDPVESVADLPPFRIEIYTFTHSREAQAFVFGVGVAGLTNKVACTWEPGSASLVHNQAVIVAFLQEEVEPGTPKEERLTVKRFKGNSYDSQAIARGTTESSRRNAETARLEDERTKKALQPLYDLGIEQIKDRLTNATWYTTADGTKFHLDWDQGKHDGPYEVSLDCHTVVQGSLDVRKEISAAIEGTGCTFDEIYHSIVVEGVASVHEVLATVDKLSAALVKAFNARRAVWRKDLELRVPMNAARRRFLTNGFHYGIRETHSRGNLALTSGGEEIGRTEIDNLTSIGWLEIVAGKYRVSQVAKDKLGLKEEVQASKDII